LEPVSIYTAILTTIVLGLVIQHERRLSRIEESLKGVRKRLSKVESAAELVERRCPLFRQEFE